MGWPERASSAGLAVAEAIGNFFASELLNAMTTMTLTIRQTPKQRQRFVSSAAASRTDWPCSLPCRCFKVAFGPRDILVRDKWTKSYPTLAPGHLPAPT